MLGGDRKLEENHRRIMDSMAKGIRSVDTDHLITFHPPGAQDSTDFLKAADFIDFHTAQTSHSVDRCYEIEKVMKKMLKMGVDQLTTDNPLEAREVMKKIKIAELK